MPLIPFNRPAFLGNERLYIERALANLHIASGGAFTAEASELLARETGSRKVLLTTSCTDALELSALLLELGPGDEVLMPSFTFVSTANAVALRGARPVFVDIRPDTYNLDERLIEAALTPRTKAIFVVHYAGLGCEMAEIGRIAQKHGLTIVEDNAHGLFGRYRGRPLGSFGALSTLSFHETKNVSCGEGGALCINDPALLERAELLHAKGTNRARFLRGLEDRYTWVDIGSSFGLSDLLAAVLAGQLEQRDRIQRTRRRLHERYLVGLEDVARQRGWTLPTLPQGLESSYHLFPLLMESEQERGALMSFLRERGILAVFHYVPLHSAPMGQRLGGQASRLPVTEDVAARLVRLPFYNTMTDDEQDQVIEAVRAFADCPGS